MSFLEILVVGGIPSAITGFFFWLMKRSIEKRDRERDITRKKEEAERERKQIEREKNRENLMIMLMQSSRAAIVLSEATARAVQRIPDAHCNGDMHAALEFADKVQGKQKDFLMELGIHSIYE